MNNNMKTLTQAETADYLEAATIINTMDAGHAIAHWGISGEGFRFMLVNDCHGNAVVTESV